MVKENSISKLQELLGIKKKSLDTLRDLKIGDKVFVPYSAFYFLQESKGQKQEFIFFLNLDCNDYGDKPTKFRKVIIYKKSNIDYVLIEPSNSFSFLSFKKEVDQFKDFYGVSQKYLQEILGNMPKDHIIEVSPAYDEEAVKEKEEIFNRFLSGDFIRVAGRELKENEKSKTSYAYLNYRPKEISNVNGKEILEFLKSKLILDEATVLELYNIFSFEDIVTGQQAVGEGIILFGPGGTGKTEIMKTMMEIFEKYLGCYVSRNEKTLKIHSMRDVTGGKWRGAYESYFTPIFNEAILKAKEKGKPSLICIDEGDEFVKTETKSNEEQVQFWKAKVGNTPEIIVCIATNLEEKQLDKPATRSKRAKKIRIPLPNIEITKKLIIHFNKINNINLNRNLTDGELEELARIVVQNKKPGANISGFCENYFNIAINAVKLLEQGKTIKEISQIKKQLENQVVDVEEYKQRFKIKVLEDIEGLQSKIQLFDIEYQQKLYQLENSVNIKELFNQELSIKLDFVNTLKNFFQLMWTNIVSSKQSNNEKLYKLETLCFILNLLPNLFNNNNYSQKIVNIKDKLELEIFLEKLFNKSFNISEQSEFYDLFENLLDEYIISIDPQLIEEKKIWLRKNIFYLNNMLTINKYESLHLHLDDIIKNISQVDFVLTYLDSSNFKEGLIKINENILRFSDDKLKQAIVVIITELKKRIDFCN